MCVSTASVTPGLQNGWVGEQHVVSLLAGGFLCSVLAPTPPRSLVCDESPTLAVAPYAKAPLSCVRLPAPQCTVQGVWFWMVRLGFGTGLGHMLRELFGHGGNWSTIPAAGLAGAGSGLGSGTPSWLRPKHFCHRTYQQQQCCACSQNVLPKQQLRARYCE